MVSTAFANTTVPAGVIKNITLGAEFVRLNTSAIQEAEGCSIDDWYVLEISEDPKNVMLSAILTAKTTGEVVHFMLSGCSRNMPKIIHVYMCGDDNSCSE